MDIDWTRESRDANAEFEALERQRRRREQEPLLYCKLVTKWPVKAFLLTVSFHVAMVAITGIMVVTGYDIFPVYFENLPFRITSEPWDARFLAWNEKDTYPNQYKRTGQESGYRTTREWYSSVDVIYDAGSGNVFTKSAFTKMQEIENDIVGAVDYTKYCQINPETRNCTLPVSILRYFDGTLSPVNPVFNDPNFDNITRVLNEAFHNNGTTEQFRYFLCKDYVINPTEVYCEVTRTLLPLGTPHRDFPDTEDYREHVNTYSADNLKPVLEKYLKDVDEFNVYFRSQALWIHDVTKQALNDVTWVGGSISFIFLLILILTKSLWIAGLAIFSIFTSFITGNLIYNVIYGYQYLGFFHILALFIILGIGADDVFVFYNIWRNSALDEYPTLAHRLSDVYKRSALSMLFTSLTTAVAFLSSAITPLLATRSFGLFSATVVIVNYLSVIIYLPTVVVMYHKYFEKTEWPCFLPCRMIGWKCSKNTAGNKKSPSRGSKDTPEHNEYMYTNDAFHSSVYDVNADQGNNWRNMAVASNLEIQRPSLSGSLTGPVANDNTGGSRLYSTGKGNEREPLPNGKINGGGPTGHKSSFGSKPLNSNQEMDTSFNSLSQRQCPQPPSRDALRREKKSLPVRFFTNYYFRFVTNRFTRWLVILAIAGLLGFFVYQASRIDVDSDKAVPIFPDDHPYPKVIDYKLNRFVKSSDDEVVLVYLVFGMEAKNLDICSFSDPNCDGEARWDSAFNPNTVEAQDALQALCETFRSLSKEDATEMRLRANPVTGEYNVKCFMEELGGFLQEESSTHNWTLPFTKEQASDFMTVHSEFYNVSGFNISEFQNILEIPISFWLYNRFTGAVSQAFRDYDPLIGEATGPDSMALNNNADILYGNKLQYVAVEAEIEANIRSLSYAQGIPVREKWEEFFNKQMESMPDEINVGFQIASPELWSVLTRKKMIVNNAVYGIIIGIGLACPILIVATGNIITGLLALFCLCCSTGCVIGVIPLGGWQLGFLEGLNLCMVVGLAVDYVVHLAEGYTHSLHNDRMSRVRDMLEEMGVSVFFGAFTTIGASAFMFLTKLTFFKQFGTFMFATLGFSFVFSMGLFVTLLGLFGPENNTGNVSALFRRCCRRNKENH